MARCYHCGKVLEDAWLKREGAALMGKTSGEKKARSPEQARKAALARWEPKPPPEPDRAVTVQKNRLPEPPKKRRRKKS